MDDITFDRWTQGFAERLSRRGLVTSAAGALGAFGLTDELAAKKKKKKRAPSCIGCKHNEVCRNGQCVDPSCGSCTSGQQCIYGVCQDPTCSRIVEGEDCALGQTCCQVSGSTAEPVCTVLDYIHPPEIECCLPYGATYEWWPTRSACCEANTDFVPNSDRERCCIFNGYPDQGTPTLCCDRSGNGVGQSVNGHCCEPSGRHCTGPDLCCNGQGCPESRVCP